ncbi:MAG: ABC transporter ATP-binding protein [bacterium]
MADDIAITVDRVSKTFKLPHEKQSTIKGALINFRKHNKSFELQQALSDISFEVKKGEFFGIIGRNGSGKSTLMKLLAGIYVCSKGGLQVNGRLTPFIELGVGFNAELTGRENIFLNGALLGFSRKEMMGMYDEIVAFAELERFMDQKLKNYSSGMQVRLAFSIAIQARNDILLIDEVLAVGDLAFQEKCYKVFEDIKNQGKTVVFISHDSSAVVRFCDRVAIIDRGELVAIGDPQDMVLQYGALVADEQFERKTNKNNNKRIHRGSGAITVQKVKVLNKAGKPTSSIGFGEAFSIEVQYILNKPIDGYVVAGVGIIDDQGISIIGPNTKESSLKPVLKKSGSFRVTFANNNLSPKPYTITVGFFNENENLAYDLVTEATSFKIIGTGRHGKVHIQPNWSFTESDN